MKKNAVALIGVVSVIVLAIAILLRPGTSLPDNMDEMLTPAEELDLFLTDGMNYGVRFSKILAEKRIERARAIGKENPELNARASETVDSLQARLAREAIIE